MPQQAYSHVQSPASSPVRARRDWDLLGNESRQAIQTEVGTTNAEHDNIGRTSPSTRSPVVISTIQLDEFYLFLAIVQLFILRKNSRGGPYCARYIL